MRFRIFVLYLPANMTRQHNHHFLPLAFIYVGFGLATGMVCSVRVCAARVCVRECVRACVRRACVRAWMRVCAARVCVRECVRACVFMVHCFHEWDYQFTYFILLLLVIAKKPQTTDIKILRVFIIPYPFVHTYLPALSITYKYNKGHCMAK